MAPDRPAFELIYKGVDIASEIAPHLVRCTYTDELDGKSDEIEVEVQDRDGLWRGPWCPEHGDKVELKIAADKAGPYVPCGAFEIDEPGGEVGRGGDTFSFSGVAAPVSKALRTKQTKGYEKTSLAGLAGQIAARHGLTLVGTPPAVSFERITQRRERDLQFLARLASDYGAYFAVRGDKMVFMRREDVHAASAVRAVDVDHPRLIRASFKRAAHKTYSKAKGSYYDGKSKKNIEVEAEDKAVRTGDTLKVDDRVENAGQARAKAKARLDKANLKKQTCTLTMVGDPYLCAGQTVTLGPGFGKWAGKYVIQKSRHSIERRGYTTEVELASV